MDNIVDVEERSHMLPESNLFSHTNTFSDELNLEDLTDKQLLILDLRYFLMNPIQKWKAKNKFPLKFTLQLFKLLLLSIQIIIFSSFNKNYVEIEKNIVKYLKLHIFDIEQNHIIYSYSSLNQQIDHISNKFKNVNSTQSINSFSGSNFICYDLRILNNIEITEVLIKLDLNKNDIIKFNNVLKERNINITKIISVYIHMEVFFNIHSHLDQHNTIIVHHRNITVHFEKRSGFYFNTEFLFDIAFNELKSDFMFPPMYLFIFDTVVTLCVLISLILTVRSVCRSNILRKQKRNYTNFLDCFQ
ncbi:hypothetical protein A3Q56_06721 [Intoshia linei]|uniref:Uncharacterized protein n=1 Tax=Intoshia linei TaxID=1819745 RepID=A0A177AU65_9BILA|nr:hypothetical protein A3Q56_06721 [Intoshia linei]